MFRPSDRRLSGQAVSLCGGRRSVGEDGRCGAPVREPIGHVSSIRTLSGQKEGEKGFPLGRTVAFPLGFRVWGAANHRVRVEL